MPSIKAHLPVGVSEMAVTAIQRGEIGSDGAGMCCHAGY